MKLDPRLYYAQTFSVRSFLVLGLMGVVLSAYFYSTLQAADISAISPKQITEKTPEELEAALLELRAQWKAREAKGSKIPAHFTTTRARLYTALCERGKPRYCPAYANIPVAKNVDIEKLAYAVAVAETSNCTKGTGVSKRNCHGIFGNNNGKYGPRTFATTEESFLAFQKLWLTKYGDRFPTLEDAKRYSGEAGVTWLNRVTIAYNRK